MRRFALVLVCGLAACGERAADAPAGTASPEAALAARHACMAEELSRTALEDLQMLETNLGGAGPAGAVISFAQAFAQHAQLRRAAYAQVDSALNHSATAEDSTRHVQAAGRLAINPPAPGSVEANVITDYDRKAAAILADADHPCNWRHELERR